GECVSQLLSALCIHLPPRLSATPPSPKEGNGDTTDWLNYHQIWRRTGNEKSISHILIVFR
ncbi:hypothetical protein, partial [Bacteroides caccae]|uniref:hypothetical protein n=1 Tax=Bacteroides caccae TaxID=47678 RepID=UPI0032ED3E42